MSKLAPLPKSKAKTAYGLLSEVCKVILQEPKRYHQDTWIERVAGLGAARLSDPAQAPACGTVGCVAGWVATLKLGKHFDYFQTEDEAQRILGLSPDQAEKLFNGSALHYLYDVGVHPGTLAYAEAGVQHIRRFQSRYAAQLKAHRLSGRRSA